MDLQKKLSMLGGKASKESSAGSSEDSITSMAPADKVSIIELLMYSLAGVVYLSIEILYLWHSLRINVEV